MTQNEMGAIAPPNKAREVTEIRGFDMPKMTKKQLVALCLDCAWIMSYPYIVRQGKGCRPHGQNRRISFSGNDFAKPGAAREVRAHSAACALKNRLLPLLKSTAPEIRFITGILV
jgi:hypothetical protein